MHQLGPETGASSKAGKAGKLLSQPCWLTLHQRELNLKVLTRLARAAVEATHTGQRGFEETTTRACREPRPLLRLLWPPPPPPTTSPLHPHLRLPTPSSRSLWAKASPFRAGPGFPLPPLGFQFAVCLVKGPWVVTETIFWL